MFGFSKWAIALAASAGIMLAVATEVHPGGPRDVKIGPNNTIVSPPHYKGGPQSAKHSPNADASLEFVISSNIAGTINSYVTALDPNGAPVMLQPGGTWFYPTNPNTAVPLAIDGATVTIPLNSQGQTTTYSLPGYCSSGRVWFAVGELDFFTVSAPNGSFAIVQPSQTNTQDPSAGINWGFIELTYTEKDGLYADVSYVDFVGLPLGMTLTLTDGTTQETLGLSSDAVTSVCSDLQAQAASDGMPWDQLCQTINGTVMRVLAPYDFVASGGAGFDDYYNDYVDKVYSSFTSTSPLTIDTQGAAGNLTCTGDGTTLTCENDEIPYQKPTIGDIFGCNSGPFANTGSDTHKANLARLCAAFNRGSFFVDGGNVQPGPSSAEYYTTSPANFYSAIVHKYEVDGKGYAFPYDDVNPADENASGTVAAANPLSLAVTVGGPSTNAPSRRVSRFHRHSRRHGSILVDKYNLK
ncbi:hypothetical protein N7478_012388 [Penicillium angulare]|uniref:uncharacterized protein n=1 Tax=Penicillium angulare TaxID=116970 RepID=UPI002540632C|nr:uncharacterized protein N7478_012388 [Penicillium angulare]KAJ5259407.1 hypothetical protein N7478_012388 [Penicillium angulare]